MGNAREKKLTLKNLIPFLSLIVLFIALFFFIDLRSKQLMSPPQTVVREVKVVPQPTPLQEMNEDKLWELVNNWKFENFGYKYQKDEILCKYALVRAKEVRLDWSHDGFDEVTDQIRAENNMGRIGENLASGYLGIFAGKNPDETALDRWLNSPLHRKNLDENYTHSCIKCKYNNCVQLFGKY